MAGLQKYTGGCHCGKVRYEVRSDLEQVISCNCSICARRAHLLTFVSTDQFKLLAGENALADYQFNKKNIHHLFCATCGVASFGKGTGADGVEMRSINVRCLDGVEIDALRVSKYDGKSH